MPIFILLCILLTVLVQTHSPYLPFLNQDTIWLGVGGIAAIFVLLGFFKKLPNSVWHEGFACTSLWAWYGYWEPLFSKGSPMFYVFPVYYALLASWMLLGFIQKSPYFDQTSQEALRYLQTYLARFDASWLAALVLLCLTIPEHYLSYPIAMTLFIVRSTFQRCLEIIDRQ